MSQPRWCEPGRGMVFPPSWYAGEPYEPEGWWRQDPDEEATPESIELRDRYLTERGAA